jgi:small subunit ribosomal protein S2
LSIVTMKNLLESGVHFGHQTKRWDPRMARYIFAERNGIHIIDLQKTMLEIKNVYEIVKKAVLENKQVLFVGTKKQARSAIKREAEKCDQFFVNNRWLGGMLTNFATIKKSIARLKKIEKMEIDGTFDALSKKEKQKLIKEKNKLELNLGGIKNMDSLPGIVFIIDPKKENIAVNEAKKLSIPIVAVCDTNCNPIEIDYPIPGNDDAIRAIELFCSVISKACLDAKNKSGIDFLSSAEEGKKEGEEEENVEKIQEVLLKDDVDIKKFKTAEDSEEEKTADEKPAIKEKEVKEESKKPVEHKKPNKEKEDAEDVKKKVKHVKKDEEKEEKKEVKSHVEKKDKKDHDDKKDHEEKKKIKKT